MKKTCTWGTSVEIFATATLFQVDIYVASDSYSKEPKWLKYAPRIATVPQATLEPHLQHKGWLEILHVSRSHFDSIRHNIPGATQRPSLNCSTSNCLID